MRALLVALHIFAVIAAAVPAPEGGMKRSAWKDPTVQDELQAWGDRLRGVGLDMTDQALQERLWTVAVAYSEGRRKLLAPFKPYYRRVGVNQSWRMFIAPHRYPARLHVSVLDDDGWRRVYVARHAEHDWRGRQLDHDRMRSALFRYAWSSYGRSWRQLCDWLAQHAAQDFPQATAVRLRFWKARTPTPQEVKSGDLPEGKWVRSRTIDLEPLRTP